METKQGNTTHWWKERKKYFHYIAIFQDKSDPHHRTAKHVHAASLIHAAHLTHHPNDGHELISITLQRILYNAWNYLGA